MRVSAILADYTFLSEPSVASRQGAFLGTAAFFKWVANDPAFDKLEVFLPPAAMSDADAIKGAAESTLLPESRGRGRLSFYPIHHLPEVWQDGIPRILRSIDPHFMARDRYFRDSFAQGPVAISVDTHVSGVHETWGSIQPLLQAPAARFDSIQCISHSYREAFLLGFAAFGCTAPPFQLDVIPRSVDCERFRPPLPGEKSEMRQLFRIPEDATVAIFHSRVGPHSKADLYPLVQAFAAASGPNDWLIVSGGSTSETAYARLEEWLIDAGVDKRSRLLGSCPHSEVRQRLWAADYFVLPCDNPSEGLGIAPIEAMATGLPVVVSDWDGMREGVREGENGYLVPTYWVPGSARIAAFSPATPHLTECLLLSQCVVVDRDALADRMGRLFRDPALRARLSSSARASAHAFHTSVVEERLLQTFGRQLQEATEESLEARTIRRNDAEKLATPTPYQSMLPGQATRSLTREDQLELTSAGRELLTGDNTIPTYHEVGMLVSPATVAQILKRLSDGPQSLGAVVDSVSSQAFDDGFYAVAMLLKRGAIRLQ